MNVDKNVSDRLRDAVGSWCGGFYRLLLLRLKKKQGSKGLNKSSNGAPRKTNSIGTLFWKNAYTSRTIRGKTALGIADIRLSEFSPNKATLVRLILLTEKMYTSRRRSIKKNYLKEVWMCTLLALLLTV